MDALDPIIHQPVRLRVMTALHAQADDAEVDFVYVRDLLKLTDGNLGTHLGKLEDAGYVKLVKTFVDRKPRTYLRLTAKGRAAFIQHVAALRALLP